MLTEKEIKFLNLLFRKLKGENKDHIDLWLFLQDFFKLDTDISFELAYLYRHNFDKANGDFRNVTEPERMSYEDYWDGLDLNIKIVMEYTKDKNPNNYEEQYGDVKHDDIDYRIYNDISELEERAIDNVDWICDDIEEWAQSYISMDDVSRRDYSDQAALEYFDDMDNDEIIDRGNIKDEIKELERQKSELIDLQSELEELKTKLENVDTDEERETIEYDIEEVESKIDDIGSEERVDSRIQDLIDETREALKSDHADDIYNELENPVEYFVGNGFYRSVRELVRSGPVEFDCDGAKEDYINNADYETIMNSAGYDSWEEVRFEGHSYILAWN